MAVKNTSFTVAKNPEKQGAWLATYSFYIGDGTGERGVATTAWTTQAAAKRWSAQQIGRTRLTWTEAGENHFKASQSIKV